MILVQRLHNLGFKVVARQSTEERRVIPLETIIKLDDDDFVKKIDDVLSRAKYFKLKAFWDHEGCNAFDFGIKSDRVYTLVDAVGDEFKAQTALYGLCLDINFGYYDEFENVMSYRDSFAFKSIPVSLNIDTKPVFHTVLNSVNDLPQWLSTVIRQFDMKILEALKSRIKSQRG